MFIIYFDGSCEPRNPGGTSAYGFIVKNEEKEIIHIASGIVGKGKEMSNNVAEYAGVINAIKWLINNNLNNDTVFFYGDSNLVISQMRGDWKIKDGLYKKYALEAIELKKQLSDPHFFWIPREENSEADYLSKEKQEYA